MCRHFRYLQGMAPIPSNKIIKLGIKKERGYLYYLDAKGDVLRVKMEEQGRASAKPEFVVSTGITKAEGFLYFIDNDGDVARSPVVI